MVRFRVRGIYSTAIIRHLLDLGHELVDPTEQQRKRFGSGWEKGAFGVAINDTEDREGIHLRGRFDELRQLIEDIRGLSWQIVCTPVKNVTNEVAEAKLYFPLEAKSELDNIRKKVTYTIPMHHYLRAGGDSLSQLVSLCEGLVEDGLADRGAVESRVQEVVSYLLPRRDSAIFVHHLKPVGRTILLGPAKAYRVGGELVIKRHIRSFGVYDGLGVEKVPGDVAVSKLKRFGWSMETRYFGLGNELKGRYVNISTPIHFYEDRVWYIDLGIDVVERPGRSAEIIDAEELEKLLEAGCISRQVRDRALQEAERHLSSTDV